MSNNVVKPDGSFWLRLIYIFGYVITLVCVASSTYFTYKGLGDNSLIAKAVSALIFFILLANSIALALGIYGRQTAKVRWIAYFFVAAALTVSTFSNSAYMFPKIFGKSELRDELVAKADEISFVQSEIKKALLVEDKNLNDNSRAFENELNQLRAQVLSAGAPGWGSKANAKASYIIRTYLDNAQLTELPKPTAQLCSREREKCRQLLEENIKVMHDAFYAKNVDNRFEKGNELYNSINTELTDIHKNMLSYVNGERQNVTEEQIRNAIVTGIAQVNEVVGKVTSVDADFASKAKQIEFSFDNRNLGSFTNGLFKTISKLFGGATDAIDALSILLFSLLVDFGPVAVSTFQKMSLNQYRGIDNSRKPTKHRRSGFNLINR